MATGELRYGLQSYHRIIIRALANGVISVSRCWVLRPCLVTEQRLELAVRLLDGDSTLF